MFTSASQWPFPTRQQLANDPQFLRPYTPDGFAKPRFLFRIDSGADQGGQRTAIIVQSDLQPDWNYAFQNASMFLAAPPESREYNPVFAEGNFLRFRIRINLSEKSTQHVKTLEKIDRFGRPRTQGKRVALTWNSDQEPETVIVPWFAKKGAGSGFILRDGAVSHLGWESGFSKDKKSMKFRAALLEGNMEVADAALFSKALTCGIGHAKAFGFGLLSVAPCKALA